MSADDDARVRLGKLLNRRRVDIDPRYHNRRIFAEERGVGYFTVLDIELAKPRSLKFEQSTVANLERAYGLGHGAIDKFLEDGGELAILDGQPAEAASAPEDESPDEPVLTIPEIRRQIHALLEMLDAYEAQQDEPPRANGGNLRSA